MQLDRSTARPALDLALRDLRDQIGELLHLLAVERRQHELALREVGALVEQDHGVLADDRLEDARALAGMQDVRRCGEDLLDLGGVREHHERRDAEQADREALAEPVAVSLEIGEWPVPPGHRLNHGRRGRTWRQCWTSALLLWLSAQANPGYGSPCGIGHIFPRPRIPRVRALSEPSRLAAAVFVLLVGATIAAFFAAQRLKNEAPLLRYRASTEAFSPNGDEIKDRAKIRFKLPEADEVTVTILDDDGGAGRQGGDEQAAREGRAERQLGRVHRRGHARPGRRIPRPRRPARRGPREHPSARASSST